MHAKIATTAAALDKALAPPPSPDLDETLRQPLPPYLVRLVHLMHRIEQREDRPDAGSRSPPRLAVSPGG